jgi:DamX protein
MSAVAHTSIDNANLASVQLNSEPAVTTISVSARIEYIQRFSKQAVLVVDNNVDVYTQAARQFLISLSKEKSNQETNVAFVSASTKLNDIQMRCRLIEQLFANILFDPEKSLAVSILTLSKQSNDMITIVVEHAQSLSLQMKYELCQLVDVANKTHSKIKVVLFGEEEAAKDAAANKTIFKNKLSIIDAISGQLLALEHAKFNGENKIFTKSLWQKIISTTVIVTGIVALSWFALIKYDDFSLSQLPQIKTGGIDENVKKSVVQLPTTIDKPSIGNSIKNTLANTSDIYSALLDQNTPIKSTYAQTTDVLQALNLDSSNKSEAVISTSEKIVKTPSINNSLITNESIKLDVDKVGNNSAALALSSNYYLTMPTGFVVQIVGFTDMALLERFTNTYPDLEYYSYQKKLNSQIFVVLTTKIYESKEQAREALQALPQTIIDRGIWIKTLETVKAEINNTSAI